MSGEVLVGQIGLMREKTLEFDSEELGPVEIPWSRVDTLTSTRVHTILLNDRESYTGTLSVTDGVLILHDTDDRRFDQDDVLSIVSGRPSESDYWSGKVSLGAAARGGNTNQVDGNLFLLFRRDTAGTRWETTYNGTVSQVSGALISNNHRVISAVDLYVSDRVFVTPASVQWFRDPFQNIEQQLTPAAGIGYKSRDEDSVAWTVSGGPAYQVTERASVAAGDDITESTFAGFFAAGIEWGLTSSVGFYADYNVTVPVPDAERFIQHVALILSLDFIENVDLDVSLFWDRVNQPDPDGAGNTPRPDDLRTVVGIGFSF